jgi:hypothetical protein
VWSFYLLTPSRIEFVRGYKINAAPLVKPKQTSQALPRGISSPKAKIGIPRRFRKDQAERVSKFDDVARKNMGRY